MELIVVGLEGGIVMIEGEANEIPEEKVVEGLELAFKELQAVRKIQTNSVNNPAKDKADVELVKPLPGLKEKVAELAEDRLAEVYKISDKAQREDALQGLLDDISSDLSVFDEFKQDDKEISESNIRTMLTLLNMIMYVSLFLIKTKSGWPWAKRGP